MCEGDKAEPSENLFDAVCAEMERVISGPTPSGKPMDPCVAAVLAASWINGRLQPVGLVLTPMDCFVLWQMAKRAQRELAQSGPACSCAGS
jgi:hypothetical protein